MNAELTQIDHRGESGREVTASQEILLQSRDYGYSCASPSHTADYLWPTILRFLQSGVATGLPKKVMEIGSGNGAFAQRLHLAGYEVVGIDPSLQGVSIARKEYPHLAFHVASTQESLADRFGKFPFVVSLEVIEHVYAPREFAERIFALLEPGGFAILTTPYHGYLKNLALAATGQLDQHFTALWDNGHIKFWSVRTLGELLSEQGFADLTFTRVGRISLLAKSMIVLAKKPRKVN